MNNFFKRGFLVQATGEVYPSSDQSVCQSIEEFISPSQKLEFLSQKKPVTFYLDGILYQAEVNEAQSRGGYFINCTEVKETK